MMKVVRFSLLVLCSLVFASTASALIPVTCEDDFLRGDANGSGVVDVADVLAILGTVYTYSGDSLQCFDAADANDDEQIDTSDAVRVTTVLFSVGGGSFPEPTGSVGTDGPCDRLDNDGDKFIDEGCAVASGPTFSLQIDEADNRDVLRTSIPTSGGNILSAGHTGVDEIDITPFIVVLDEAGSELWRTTVDALEGYTIYEVVELAQPGAGFVAALVKPFTTNVVLARFSIAGSLLTYNELQLPAVVTDFTDLIRYGDNEVVAAGNISGKGFIIRADTDAEILWSEVYGQELPWSQRIATIRTRFDGQIEAFGAKNESIQGGIWKLRVSPEGYATAESRFAILPRPDAVQKTRLGGFLVASSDRPHCMGLTDEYMGCVYKLAPAGGVVWATPLGDAIADVDAIGETYDGGAYVAGRFEYPQPGLARLSSEGELLWVQSYADEAWEPMHVLQLPDKGFLVTTDAVDGAALDFDALVVRVDENGEFN